MELVEQDRVRRQMGLEERARLLVAGAVGHEPVTREEPARVGVGDEHRAVCRVEQDRVDGLRAQAGDRQHLAPEGLERRPSHAGEAAPEALEQPARERLQPPGLEAIGPGGADGLAQLPLAERGDPVRAEQAARAERADRARRVRPRRVLREHGPHGHLVGRACRPPSLGPMAALQRDVEAQQPRLRRIQRRTRNVSPLAKDR
jgi:hypothetical protein